MAEHDDDTAQAADDHDNEQARQAALRRYAVLDTGPEALYDDVTLLAAQICATPIALVSLVDASRQWFKSRVGLDVAETPRDIAFCHWAIQGDELFEVADASDDARFRDNPLVTGEPGIRFYAGAPLCSPDGHRLGTLCVIDRKSRSLTPQQRAALQVLARQVMLQLEMRRNLGELTDARAALQAETERLARSEAVQRRAEQFMRGTLDALQDNIAIVDRAGVIVHVNRSWETFARDNAGGLSLASCMPGANYLAVCDRAAQGGAEVADAARKVARATRALLADGDDAVGDFSLEYPCHAPQERRWFDVHVTAFGAGQERFAVLSHRNITARRQAEKDLSALNASLEGRVLARTRELESANAALRASEERFRSVFENASVGAVLIAREGQMLQANAAFGVIAGRDAQALSGLAYRDIMHPDDLESLLALRAQVIDGRTPGYVQEARIVHPDGTVAWVHISVSAVRNSAGLVTQTMALVQDISEHRLAAYERDQFFELSVDMFVIVDLAGDIHRSNPACQRILGYDEAELAQMRYLDVVHPDDRAQMRLELARLSTGATVELIDVRMRDKSGRYHDVRWSVALWGERGLVLAVGRDITAKRSAERALREREAMLARAEEMAMMGSWSLDLDHGTARCSSGFLALAGQPGPAESRDLGQVLPMFLDEDRPMLRQAIDHAAARGLPTEVTFRLLRSDGSVRELQIFIEPRRAHDGKVIGVSGACLDVTAFRQATRQAQQSEQRLRALADRLQGIREEERSRISREIHDELGQMLTALKIDITLLARDLQGGGPVPERAQLLEDTQAMGRMVDATMQSVRRIARQLRPEVLDAMGLVPAIEWQASDVQARTGLRCTVEASEALNDVDPRHGTALFRIVQEALTNVVRHADASQVDIVLKHTDDALLLSVHDDGKGFDPQAAGANPSLGILGMRERAVCNDAVFELDSRPGAGTRITVRVPLSALPPPHSHEETAR